jgi:hypothetical protein
VGCASDPNVVASDRTPRRSSGRHLAACSRGRIYCILMGSCSRMVALVGAAMSIISCTSSRPDLPRRLEQIAYLRDRLSRRSALVASLVDPDNGYSRLRLER